VLTRFIVLRLLGVVYVCAFATHAFQAVQRSPDYGVSAISAAWIGAVASTAWRAPGRKLRGKIVTVLAVAATALVGWMLRGHVSILDLEHLVAFAIGLLVAVWTSRTPRPARLEVHAVPS
jgi:membrane associated rhomboid family serine protease